MNHIKKLNENKGDAFCHRKFIKFGLGEYKRELIILKFSAKNIQIKAGFEYVDVFYKFLIKLIKKYDIDGTFEIKGMVISKKDLKTEFDKINIELKKIIGKKYSFEANLNSKEFIKFVETFSDTSYLIVSLKSDLFQIKTKNSIPKPGKIIEKFVNAKVNNKFASEVKDEFLFDIKTDVKDIKSAEISHVYFIESIKVPKNFENDPAEARLNAIRKGIIKRKIDLVTKTDTETIEKKIKFEI